MIKRQNLIQRITEKNSLTHLTFLKKLLFKNYITLLVKYFFLIQECFFRACSIPKILSTSLILFQKNLCSRFLLQMVKKSNSKIVSEIVVAKIKFF